MNRTTSARRHGAALLLTLLAGSARADDNGVFNTAALKSSDGEQIYQHICQGCHMPDGKGAVGAGRYPAFAGNPAIASARYMAATILYGRRDMPSFIDRGDGGEAGNFRAVSLGDAQIAAVVDYIRTHFGNQYQDKLDATEVAAMKHH